MTNRLDPHEIMNGLDRDGVTRLIIGAPGSGKTGFAVALLVEALRRYGGAGAAMAVPGRVAAESLSNEVIHRLGFSQETRPVGTLGAMAFRVVSALRAVQGLVAPRLLNGAEQDALLRTVMAVHLKHAALGDDCNTCDLLREYFAQDDWAHVIRFDSGGDAFRTMDSPNLRESNDSVPVVGGSSSVEVFTRGISDAFIGQLRDMLARLDELGVGPDEEDRLLRRAIAEPRLTVQWKLAFALRKEYIVAQRQAYPGQYRLDASYLLVAGMHAVREAMALWRQTGKVDASGTDMSAQLESMSIPRLLVVDDVQDTTLAGMRFLEVLGAAGVKLVLVGNPDESVQSFRGSYPEYLMRRAVRGSLGAIEEPLARHEGAQQLANTQTVSPISDPISMVRLVASRVSLSIPSPEDEPLPPALRSGKITDVLNKTCEPGLHDGTLFARLYRSAREELDDVVWRMKRSHLDHDVKWNDMVIIAHDNATVRRYGERLRRDGVPVRYSSITRPLKDESLVQGLFAVLELAQLRIDKTQSIRMKPADCASYVHSRVRALMGGPLITTGDAPGRGVPGRIAPVDSAMNALESLAPIAQDSAFLSSLLSSWESICDSIRSHACETGCETLCETGCETSSGVSDAGSPVIETLDIAQQDDGSELSFGADALYVMLGLDLPSAPARSVVEAVHAVLGEDPQARAFANLWAMVSKVSNALRRLPVEQRSQPRYALSAAWEAAGLASVWQRTALLNTEDGRTANDRLDAAMRLFQFAEDAAASRDLEEFMAQVRGMEVQADSLAHVGPVEDAVMLTTPAGAAGRHWRYAWIPQVQQDVWPNLAGRNTMFGGEDLAELVLRGPQAISHNAVGGSGMNQDPQFTAVMSAEKKGFLVALTRAEQIAISAVWNDDLSPSDFLFGYMPEYFPRNRQQAQFAAVGDSSDDAYPDYAGLDADPRGLVAAARTVMATHEPDEVIARDAAQALALLAVHGVESADPANWAFTQQQSIRHHGGDDAHQAEDVCHRDGTDGTEHCRQHGRSSEERCSSAPSAAAQTPMARTAMARTSSGPDTAAQSVPSLVVTLSPSAVDGLWACPVCWMLENRFAGPRMSSVATGFGTVIHAVAQQGSEEGLDLLSCHADRLEDLGLDATASIDQRIEAVHQRLLTIYQGRRPDPSSIADTGNRYAATRKDESAQAALGAIADYFVRSDADPEAYLGKNAKNFAIGRLAKVECEREFTARFGWHEIAAAYNALSGVRPIDRSTLMRMMGALVGGWPEGMDEGLIVRLSGRIDRMEHRVLADGSERIRLIDYKTGKVPSVKRIFNDLQLVCYQLGLAFPEVIDGDIRKANRLDQTPTIAQSALFHVGQHAAPAHSYAPEGAFQPPLFVDGALNETPFTARQNYQKLERFLDMPMLNVNQPPCGVPVQAWQQFTAFAGTQTLWALTMIARVMYAAAAIRSSELTAHPQSTHIEVCRMKDVCPACAGQISTVFETRQA
ncbi:PD-(D/E)XK nuclease family protein [Bifidobacterium scaligerum]|uniref:Nuclease n=1 Tax=Bifidobacterium scaligerum TaxID=2052656 RepID=A0A2M9HPE1_9BIFI|nr:PD-(D/E)XK nuclease family protein [Bifidobacterium scaligerum]PJM78698.1 nuclease [Bifidobacterium scaligerum]